MNIIHLFGFGDKTSDKMYEINAWLKNNLASTTPTPDIATGIMHDIIFTGHTTPLVVDAQFEDTSYIVVQTFLPVAAHELAKSLACMPHLFPIFIGAGLQCFVPATRPSEAASSQDHVGACQKGI